jgi:putative transposase
MQSPSIPGGAMPRQPRNFSPDVAYHIITRGNNRQTLFRKDEDFAQYLFFLRFLKSEFPFELYHHCLMTNHVHLLMRFPFESSFQKVPQRLSLLYAKYFARQYRHVGHVFQDRFKSIPVADNAYLLECGRYIERNPLNARMVKDPAKYKWSSHGFYVSGKEDSLLTENPLFTALESNINTRRRNYATFVRTNRPYEEAVEKIIFGKNSLRNSL